MGDGFAKRFGRTQATDLQIGGLREEDAAGAGFARRCGVIILKKYNQYSFLALPLTTAPKPNPYRLPIGIVDGKKAFATLSQLRNIDSKRLVKKIMHLNAVIFVAIKTEASRVNFG
jgi:mRNA-degrading endonuclease toxin of MazEF toxin-antitoxin module